jgi:hypothetical protein
VRSPAEDEEKVENVALDDDVSFDAAFRAHRRHRRPIFVHVCRRERDVAGKIHGELPAIERTVGKVPERRREGVFLVGNE